MRVVFWSIALCAVGALAAPNSQQIRRASTSQEGSCGASNGNTCLGSFLGDCCSSDGQCGNTNIYCGQGCQSDYGNCTGTVNGLMISNDGSCGSGVTCQGSIYGDCCSEYGFCGSTSDYCDTTCDDSSGLCGTTTSSASTTIPTAYGNSTTTTRALAASTTNPTCPVSNGTIYIASSLNQYEVECGFDRPGNDIKMVSVYSNTISGCVTQCEATNGCVDIIMSGTSCYLKNKVGKPKKSANLRGARLFKRGPSPSNTFTTASSPTTSASSTSATASSTSGTITLTGASSTSSGTSATSREGSATSTGPAPTSINPTCPASNTTEFVASSGAIFLIECYMDRVGNDMGAVQIYSNRITDCINKCDSTQGCIDISMSGTSCYMKSQAGSYWSSNKQVRGARMISAAPSRSSTMGSSSLVLNSSSSSVVSAMPSGSANLTSSSASATSSSSSAAGSSNITSSTAGSTVGSIISSTTNSTINSSVSSTWASGYPHPSANITSLPTGTGISSSTSLSLSTGASSYVQTSGTSSSVPYGNDTETGTSKTVSPTAPIGTGSSSSLPHGTGASSGSSSSTRSVPYGNGTSIGVSAGPTGTGASSSIPLGTGITSVPGPTNSTTSTSITIPLTTAPLTTGASSGGSIPTSNDTGSFTNSTTITSSTTAATSTTSYAFLPGGISSGHPLASNTTACTTKPISTGTCNRCEGQPGTDRFCGYTASDNSYDVMPKTCNTVEYSIDLTECTVSPDGLARKALCVNGQTPGPLIKASWGDTVVVHVTNSMSKNGTSIHWHGMRQNYTNEMDGVVSITQCALAPGQSQTYTFKATNYGFSWYHSHLTLQAYEGLFGPMRIHGPVSQSADAEAGNLIIQDWSHVPVDDMYIDAQINGVRTMDTGLINGMNVWGDDGSSNQTGQRYTVPTSFVPGQSYLFNIVNTAIQSTYRFYIDGHKMTVISADFVPIVPYETDVLSINIGQRYQVIVTADQAVGDYWLRFDNQNACASTVKSDNIKGIIHYAGSAGGLPTSTAYNYTRKYAGDQILGECKDEELSNLIPYSPIDVGTQTTEVGHNVVVSNSNSLNLYRWYLDGTTFQSNWADATLYGIYNNDTIPDYSGNLAIELPNLGEWVYVIIESPVPLGHPIHLHGHDFHILARGFGTYNSGVELNLKNPPRRDVAFMPGDGPTGQGGFLVLAFLTDNPGAWLMHCHIGWHVAMGFALQFIEGQDLIKDTVTDSCMLNDVCDTWRDWADEYSIHTDDSGV